MSHRQRIIESHFGRDYGWYVEADGEVVAALVDARPAGPGCDSYRLEPLTADPAMAARLTTEAFWVGPVRLVFRNRWFDAVAARAAPCAGAEATLRTTGRLAVRGLSLAVPRSPWARLRGWLGPRRRPAAVAR